MSAWSHPIHPAQPTAKLAEVYPSSAELPENLLRFYLHFSAPMSRGEAYRHISLVNVATGKPVDSPFLELDEELWSSDGTRFTLVFDPGRIRRGIKPREELGPVLEAGKSYMLVVDRDWPNAHGTPLRSEFRKPFRVGPPDETSPDPRKWRIDPPRSGTTDPLTARLPEPLDRGLLDRLIAVHDATGKVVHGRRSIESGETIWRFTPEAVWRPGEYRLAVGTDLEDRAGNSVARPFEVDLAGPISKQIKSETIALPFRIAPLSFLRLLGFEQGQQGPAAGRDPLRVAYVAGRPGGFGPASVVPLLRDQERPSLRATWRGPRVNLHTAQGPGRRVPCRTVPEARRCAVPSRRRPTGRVAKAGDTALVFRRTPAT